MTDRQTDTPTSKPVKKTGRRRKHPRARVRRRRRFSTTWLLTIAVIAVVAWAYRDGLEPRGSLITVRFPQAHGLAVGDALTHLGVRAGTVERVQLAPDLSGVEVQIRLADSASPLAVDGSKFWIVRPEVSLSRVANLETLVGPRSVAVDPGEPDAQRLLVFDGLDTPPATDNAAPAPGSLTVHVHADQRGSIEPGSPILYRGVTVGRVSAIRLAELSTKVEFVCVIEPRYKTLVRENSRFWNAGGLSADFGLLDGLTLSAESLESALNGALAFATPTDFGAVPQDGHQFDLAPEATNTWLRWEPRFAISPI